MDNMIFLVTLLVIGFVPKSFCLNSMQTSIGRYSASNPFLSSSLSRRYSLATNNDIQSILMSGSKSGNQPTIVAIPLYIRGNLSRYPSIFELLSYNSNQQIDTKPKKSSETQPNASDGTNSFKKSVEDNIKPNDFVSNYSTQRYRIHPQKSIKYLSEEPKVVPQRDQNKYDIQPKESSDYSGPQKTQWSSQMSNSPNRYLQPYSRHSQRFPTEEYRKQNQPEYEPVLNTYSSNSKYNDIQSKEQKVEDSPDYGSVDGIKTNSEAYNRNNGQNYWTFGSSTEGRVVPRNIGSEKLGYTQSSDTSQEKPNFGYSEPEIRDENYSMKNNDNKYENQNNDYKYSNKNNEYEYRSPPLHIRSYERSVQSNQFTTPINGYNSRPSGLRQSYVNSYVTSKPFTAIPSDEESSHSMSSDNYNSNFQPIISSNGYSSQTNPSNSGSDSQTSGYGANGVNPSVYIPETQSDSPNNSYMKTESKPQFTSISNPNYSSDYSTPEDIDCFDENSNDYKSTYSSIKSQNSRPEMDTKNNERDNYDTQDLDPTKLDVKIVHLPVSLLRRLIGSGDISLPGYQ